MLYQVASLSRSDILGGMEVSAPFALALQKLALGSGTNMDEQDRQDGIHVSFQSTIVREFCATLLVEEGLLTRTK